MDKLISILADQDIEYEILEHGEQINTHRKVPTTLVLILAKLLRLLS